MNKKVNIENASAAWLWLMILPFANGFILRSEAKKIFEKLYKYIGLLCGIVSILSVAMAFIFPFVGISVIDGTVREFWILTDWIFDKMIYVFFISYLGSIVAAFLMRNKYKYKKSVLNCADKYHVLYNDFETAENEVVKIAAQNNDKLEENEND